MKEGYVLSIDQGTSSSRCLLFNTSGKVVSSSQQEQTQHYPRSGWVQQDALEIWDQVVGCVNAALKDAQASASVIAAIGITNQRESTLVWNKHTGVPYHPLIVWNDTRTSDICEMLQKEGGADRFREQTGLPVATYFSATKILWLFEHVKGLREDAMNGTAVFGTMDTWLMWKLTQGKTFVTDVTNASRTMLMNLKTLAWDQAILDSLGVPNTMLPEIRSSSEVYAAVSTPDLPGLEGVKIAGVLGDQQAALFGQNCFEPGAAKCTYGTGAFILMNSGSEMVPSTHGLLTTVGYKLGDAPPVYALEGSIAYAGSVVQWARDNLGLIEEARGIETLAKTVDDNGGVYFVPAFAGLFAPYWRMDARGVICGLTAYNTKGHLARAVLEATVFQVTEVLQAMRKDSQVELKMLRVDGGMTGNGLLMQLQADALDKQVLRPRLSEETTALGAAFAAGLAVGVWSDLEQLRAIWAVGDEYWPAMKEAKRSELLRRWRQTVKNSLGWEGHADAAEEGPGLPSGDFSSSSPLAARPWQWWHVLGAACAGAVVGAKLLHRR
ncbi:unnamed protein product [Chrysoparadoxa australica]